MRRSVVLAASARLAASFFAALLLMLAVPTMAAERALIDFIGYSDDGRYFAFEEFGQTDGAGGNYVHIFVVDLSNDSWLPGTPVMVAEGGDTDEAPPLRDSRDKARAQVAPLLAELRIDQPVSILALNGDGERADGKMMQFWTPSCCGIERTEDTEYKLTLTTFAAKGADNCQDSYALDMGVVGYALSVDVNDEHSELHRDGDRLPKSRGCTLDYRLYGVVEPFQGGPGARVAIVASYPFGFEGPDRRFLAVPIDR